ncbi:uncharacterized protein LOC125316167 isoform X2 [Rhodamnia argentea]|uniref:Uncharacterized protein LOC125316167 isoform X2 n=1 Tax=Rhodamnia argentea TaxID=178133 RepID=A0ABM3HSN2_9MYRT|nr:uncharacterized protein LOC125316167 isoform X2 [Rhodamnia argentea]
MRFCFLMLIRQILLRQLILQYQVKLIMASGLSFAVGGSGSTQRRSGARQSIGESSNVKASYQHYPLVQLVWRCCYFSKSHMELVSSKMLKACNLCHTTVTRLQRTSGTHINLCSQRWFSASSSEILPSNLPWNQFLQKSGYCSRHQLLSSSRPVLQSFSLGNYYSPTLENDLYRSNSHTTVDYVMICL